MVSEINNNGVITMENYNGYQNRETYDVVLWCQNDEGLYHMFRDQDAQTIKIQFQEWADQSVTEPMELTEELRSVLRDIGSLWRVNWYEVSDALTDETEEESV